MHYLRRRLLYNVLSLFRNKKKDEILARMHMRNRLSLLILVFKINN